MAERKEIELVKQIIKENNLSQKILREELKKLLVKEGLSLSSANNYIYILKACDLILEDFPFLVLDKKLFEAKNK